MTLDYCSRMAEWFNEWFPVGSEVTVRRDSGELVKTRVRYPAQAFGDMHGWNAIAWFEDIAGHYTILDLPDGRERIMV